MNSMSSRPILTAPAHPASDAGEDPAPGDILDLTCTSPDRSTLRVALSGEADHFSSHPLRVLLAAAAGYGYRTLVLDCRRLRFCDTALLTALESWQRSGGQVHVDHPTPHLRLLLDVETRRYREPSGRRLVSVGRSATGPEES
ncbi:STAS domain-containing protein [Streptomyces aquilus]|uniref:STAS domain-containing protein n=1 Tax=Streptomyces aquilus TaxID=2548456 RepID=UPI0036C34ED1